MVAYETIEPHLADADTLVLDDVARIALRLWFEDAAAEDDGQQSLTCSRCLPGEGAHAPKVVV